MASSINGPLVTMPRARRAGVDHAEGARGGSSRAGGIGSAEPSAGASDLQTVSEPGAVAQAAQKVRDFLQITRRDLEFSVDKESGRTIIRVLDAATGELVRQIPPHEVLAIARRLDQPEGVLFRGHA